MPQTFDRLLLSSRTGINVSKQKQKLTCEAYDCNKPATKQITIDAGRHGNIDLNLCNSCIPIFKNTEKLTASQQQLTSDRMADPDDILLSTA
jgi:hypothetical protein